MRRALLLAALTAGCLHDWDAIPVGFADAARDAVDVAVVDAREVNDVVVDAGDAVEVSDAAEARDAVAVIDASDGTDARDVADASYAMDALDAVDVLDAPDAPDLPDVRAGIDAIDVVDAPTDADVVDVTVSRDALDVPDVSDVVDVRDVVDAPPADVCTLRCDGICVDPTRDNAHCGSCSRGCSSPLQCLGGTCLCPTGQQLCGAVCANIATDPYHCGSCTTVCPRIAVGNGTSTCLGGSCRIVCDPGFAMLSVGGTTTCAAFGGASVGPVRITCVGNPYNFGLCECPTGFLGRSVVVQRPDRMTAALTWCDANTYAPASEWGGAYVRHEQLQGMPPMVVCRAANPYTGSCTCGAEFAAIELPFFTTDGVAQVLGLCNRGTTVIPRERTFLGAFALYAYGEITSGPGGVHCATPNPLTGDCTCPPSARAVSVQTTARGYDTTTNAWVENAPIDLSVCMR